MNILSGYSKLPTIPNLRDYHLSEEEKLMLKKAGIDYANMVDDSLQVLDHNKYDTRDEVEDIAIREDIPLPDRDYKYQNSPFKEKYLRLKTENKKSLYLSVEKIL